jgi:hypothetical protein
MPWERIGGRRKRDRQGDYAAPSIPETSGRIVLDRFVAYMFP